MDKLFVYRRWCKGCGICVEFCPKDVFEMGPDGHAEVVFPEQCADCGLCVVLCPDFAIKGPLPRSVKRG
jgi:2-oxoglutarate ferredoxin oxidoreductase subunit delta